MLTTSREIPIAVMWLAAVRRRACGVKLVEIQAETFELEAGEADSLIGDIAHRRGRSRFVGNFLRRKGVAGFVCASQTYISLTVS